MMYKRQIIALGLSAMLSTSLQAMSPEIQAQLIKVANYLSNLNPEQVQTQFKDNLLKLEPVAQKLVTDIQNRKFDNIADLIAIDLTPAVDFLHNHMDTLKNTIETGLPAALELMQGLPADVRARARAAQEIVVDHIDILDSLKSRLGSIRDYTNLARHKGTLAEALRTIAESDQAQELVNILQELKDKLAPVLAQIKEIDVATLRNAVVAAQNVLQQQLANKPITIKELTPIAKFVNELRTKLAPSIPLIASVLGDYAQRINALAKKIDIITLPKPVASAAGYLQDKVHALSKDIRNLNNIIQDVKNRALQQ